MLIVMDMDGTLYDLADVAAANFEIQIEFLSKKTGLTRADAVSYFENHDVYPVVTEKSRSATELFAKEGFSLLEWNDFRKARFPIEHINTAKAASPDTVCGFRKLGACTLLTSNSFSAITAVLGKLSVPIDVFDAIVCSDRYDRTTPFKKIDAMHDLLDRFSAIPEQLISIGDRFKTDIAPALALGGAGFLVNMPSGLDAVLRDIESGSPMTCKDYTYYPIGAAAATK